RGRESGQARRADKREKVFEPMDGRRQGARNIDIHEMAGASENLLKKRVLPPEALSTGPQNHETRIVGHDASLCPRWPHRHATSQSGTAKTLTSRFTGDQRFHDLQLQTRTNLNYVVTTAPRLNHH